MCDSTHIAREAYPVPKAAVARKGTTRVLNWAVAAFQRLPSILNWLQPLSPLSSLSGVSCRATCSHAVATATSMPIRVCSP